jgi:hypothetical protein
LSAFDALGTLLGVFHEFISFNSQKKRKKKHSLKLELSLFPFAEEETKFREVTYSISYLLPKHLEKEISRIPHHPSLLLDVLKNF